VFMKNDTRLDCDCTLLTTHIVIRAEQFIDDDWCLPIPVDYLSAEKNLARMFSR
jgi:hypothetical protein